MQYRKSDDKNSREIFFSERIAHSDRQAFFKLIDSFTKTTLRILILNFTDTKFIDSAGMGLLMIAKQVTYDNKKKLILRNPKHHVKRTFHTMNFEHIFTIEGME